MPHSVMAADAGDFYAVGRLRYASMLDRLGDLRMALTAGRFRDLQVVMLDPQGVWKVAGRKRERIPEAVRGLGPIFTEKS